MSLLLFDFYERMVLVCSVCNYYDTKGFGGGLVHGRPRAHRRTMLVDWEKEKLR